MTKTRIVSEDPVRQAAFANLGRAAGPVWHIAQAFDEAAAAGAFHAHGITAFAPQKLVKLCAKRGMRARDVMRPVFSGYVFARLRPVPEAWAAALAVPGVSRLLGDGEGRPFALADAAMDAFIAAVGNGDFDEGVLMARARQARQAEIAAAIRAGKELQIAEGPFAGLKALAEPGWRGTKAVRVLAELLGGRVGVMLTLDDLLIADAA